MEQNIRSKAANIAGKAKERVESEYNKKKDVATIEIHHLVSALRTAADNVRNDGGSSVSAALLTRAAERLDTLGSSFSGKDLDGIVDDVERMARRNPAAFIGGAMLLGFAASRFLKSSGRHAQSWDNDYNTMPPAPAGDLGGL